MTEQRIEIPLSIPDQLAEVVLRNAARFPLAGEDRLYALGPHAALYGQRAEDWRGSASQRPVALEQGATRFVAAEPGPLLLEGELSGSLGLAQGERSIDLAIAVDGIVRALTRNLADAQGQPRELWSAVLPESALTPGPHQLEFYEIDAGPGGRPVLHSLAAPAAK
jgi:hypothetical protein